MRSKRLLWFGLVLIAWMIVVAILLFSTNCKSEHCLIKQHNGTVFITHDDGRTEILVVCLNISDRYVFNVMAEISVKHMQTEQIFDCIKKRLNTIEPREVRKFSVWTDKLTFGDDVGVRAKFTHDGVG